MNKKCRGWIPVIYLLSAWTVFLSIAGYACPWGKWTINAELRDPSSICDSQPGPLLHYSWHWSHLFQTWIDNPSSLECTCKSHLYSWNFWQTLASEHSKELVPNSFLWLSQVKYFFLALLELKLWLWLNFLIWDHLCPMRCLLIQLLSDQTKQKNVRKFKLLLSFKDSFVMSWTSGHFGYETMAWTHVFLHHFNKYLLGT